MSAPHRSADSAANEPFELYTRRLNIRYYRLILLLMMGAVLVFWPTDYLLFRDRPVLIEGFGAVRIRVTAVCACMLAVGLLTHRRWPGLIFGSTVIAFAGISVAFASAVARVGGVDQDWLGYIFLLPTTIFPFLLGLRRRILASGAIFVSFTSVYFSLAPREVAYGQAFRVIPNFLFVTVLIVVVGHMFYRTVRENHRRGLELEEMNRAQNQMFASVSHELRTPLTLILSALRRLESAAPRRRAELIASGLRNAQRLTRQIDDVLEVTRFASGRNDPQLARTDVARLLRDVAADFWASGEGRDQLTVEGMDTPQWAAVDPRQVRHAMYNLLGNAFKFTDQDARRIRMTLSASPDTLHLAVDDNGPGIAEADLVRIFDRFVQGDGSLARKHGGTGIGLALVDEIARAHGGGVVATSRLAEGSRFTVTLPRGDPDAFDEWSERDVRAPGHTQTPAPQIATKPDSAATERPTIVVADDDRELCAYLTELLSADHHVRAAYDGASALQRMREGPPDLAVLDVMMPEIDGIELLTRMRADPELAGIPVLLLTARAGTRARVEAYEAGAQDYVEKPFDEAELLVRVHNLLTLKDQEARLRDVNRDLEQRVAERTATLRRLALHLETAREEERRRLARELHDDTAQLITGLRMEVDLVRDQLPASMPSLVESLDRLDDLLEQLFASNRAIVSALRPRVLDELGLVAAIKGYIDELERGSQIRFECSFEPGDLEAPPTTATVIFRAAQEALTNVQRHSGATRARLQLRREDGDLMLTVSDDGRGFDTATVGLGHFGLVGLRERVEALGGELEIDSAPGRGARTTVRLPLSPATC